MINEFEDISIKDLNDVNDLNSFDIILNKLIKSLNSKSRIEEKLQKISNFVLNHEEKFNQYLEENLESLIKISHSHLKKEWERVKEETQKGYFVKGKGDDWINEGF